MDHLDSKSFVPFKKGRKDYKLPVLAKRVEDQVIDDVDPDLRPAEQGFVRHYLAYADILLKNSESGEQEDSGEEQPDEKEASQPGLEEASIKESSVEEAAIEEAPASQCNQESNLAEMPLPEPKDSKAA